MQAGTLAGGAPCVGPSPRLVYQSQSPSPGSQDSAEPKSCSIMSACQQLPKDLAILHSADMSGFLSPLQDGEEIYIFSLGIKINP